MYVCSGKGSGVRLAAGLFFWVVIVLTLVSGRYMVLIGALPATMLLVSYFTGWCPTERALEKFGANRQIRVVPPDYDKKS